MRRERAIPQQAPNTLAGLILVVEPDDACRDTIASALHDSLTTYSVSTFEEATDLLYSHKFDLVIADVTCQDDYEQDFCSVVRQSFPEIAVIATSPARNLKEAAAAIRAGCVGLIMKPFRGTQISKLAEAALSSQNLKLAARVGSFNPAQVSESVLV